ncbi:hypothetical protein [Vulgatibacter incomptus]|uniref:Lipoprotein n=1 Tax=Vulgatibacter incomptus TaxID=1391653 RepID=A0A0K1PG77_9BACT|nr:hypothetical protein [Vulgatibacter incomptus]AKU92114.1 hypothetical protein AKJ08_2501 [Vulgatibacter incomptus]
MRNMTIASLLLLALAACDGGKEPAGGNEDPGTGGSDGRIRCTIGASRDPASALPIELGESTKGHVCPRRDSDWFRFVVPPGQPLVTVELGYSEGARSPVSLAYELYLADEPTKPVASGANSDAADRRSSLHKRHYLGLAGGTYVVRIHDAADVAEDAANAWSLRITAEADPDLNEPNESCAQATRLSGSAKGAISFEGDRDAFVFPVAASQIVTVRLRSEATQVALKATLYDAQGRALSTRSNPRRGTANEISMRRAVPGAGEVCVVVEDLDGKVADPAVLYSLEATFEDEIDANDRGGRNDTPATATSLGRGGESRGSIFSPGDLDWFRVDAVAGEILDVEVTCDDCDFDLAVNLVYGHEASPCSEGDSCDYLLTTRSCEGGAKCPSGVCRDTPEGARCASSCGGDLDCPAFQCQNAGGGVNACVGGAVCVPESDGGRCGVVQYGVIAAPGSSQQIRFAQPVLRGPVYVLVHDFRDDDWSAGTYRIRATLREDPDPNEVGGRLNNFYLPYTDVAQLSEALVRGRDLATPAPWEDVKELAPALDPVSGEPVLDDDTGEPVMEEVVVARVASGHGCIGFTADVDVFRVAGGNPCVDPDETDEARRKVNCGMVLEVDRPAGGAMDLAWFIVGNDMRPRSSFLESQRGGDKIFGDNACVGNRAVECNVYNANDEGDYHVVVYDSGLDDWDADGSHCYTWKLTATVTPGCPQSCPVPHERSGLCTCGS